jgi:ligand-binding sensor domain-containing protein
MLAQKDHYNFEQLTTKDGLFQNSVVKIFQDSRKFLWFSTFDGLNRYDGYNFKVYKSNLDDTTTISGQGFGPICEDRYGKLWIGSLDGGLNLYDSMTDTFRRFKFNPNDPHSLSSNLVKDLYLDSNGRLWIGTENGLDQFDYKTEKFIHYKFNPDNSNSLSNNFVLSIA